MFFLCASLVSMHMNVQGGRKVTAQYEKAFSMLGRYSFDICLCRELPQQGMNLTGQYLRNRNTLTLFLSIVQIRITI